eukprot:3338015-Ditylum_brightwellii.AAC.2
MAVITLETSQEVLREIVGCFVGGVEGGPFLGGAFFVCLAKGVFAMQSLPHLVGSVENNIEVRGWH